MIYMDFIGKVKQTLQESCREIKFKYNKDNKDFLIKLDRLNDCTKINDKFEYILCVNSIFDK